MILTCPPSLHQTKFDCNIRPTNTSYFAPKKTLRISKTTFKCDRIANEHDES